ncbi:MAG: asparaginase, partial [Ruminococcus sp.]|nr:asparaginase [Ruminococcus sp.]
MKKILVIFTGGTIMCRSENGIISIDPDMGRDLIDMYRLTSGDNSTEFEIRSPFFMLSENMGLRLWNDLIHELASYSLEEYEGV